MILPLHETIAVQKAKPLRFDYSGLVLVIRGHEELFFEIGSVRKRDDLLTVIVHQLQLVVDVEAQASLATKPKQELHDLEALHKIPTSPGIQSDMSQIMFSSTTSSFVTFQPPKALHSRCFLLHLTIDETDSLPYISHLPDRGITRRRTTLHSLMLWSYEGGPYLPHRIAPRI